MIDRLEEIGERNKVVTEIIAGGECPYDVFLPMDVPYLLHRLRAAEELAEALDFFKDNPDLVHIKRLTAARNARAKTKEAT